MLWKDRYKLGVPRIDEQHKELFRRVGLFLQVLRSAVCWDEKLQQLNEMLEFMKGYVVEHFHDEEEYQLSINYPGYEIHKQIHSDMVNYVQDVSRQFEQSDDNEELMNAYLTNGNKVIPKVIAIDKEEKEAAVWGPRAPMTAIIQKDIMKDMPEKGTAEYDAAFTAVKKEMKEKFMTSPELWDAVETDLKQTLSVK